MSQKLEMLPDAPAYAAEQSHLNRNREVQELIKLLVEAVLTLPDNERRRVIDEAVAPLFEALLTLKKVPGIGLIWMALLCTGYRDLARRLSPLEAWLNEETPSVEVGTSKTAAEIEETSDVA